MLIFFCSRGQYNQHHIDDNNTTNMKQNKLKSWSLTCEERWRRLSLRLFVRAFALQTFLLASSCFGASNFYSSMLCICCFGALNFLNAFSLKHLMHLAECEWMSKIHEARENAVAGCLYWLCWACLHAHAGSLIVFNPAWSSLKDNLFRLFFIFNLGLVWKIIFFLIPHNQFFYNGIKEAPCDNVGCSGEPRRELFECLPSLFHLVIERFSNTCNLKWYSIIFFLFTDHFFFPGSSLLCQYCVCELLQRSCDVGHVLQVVSCQQAFLQLFVLFEFLCHVLHVVFLELDEFFFFHLNDPVDDCLVDSFFEPWNILQVNHF